MVRLFPEDPAQRHLILRFLMAVLATVIVLVMFSVAAWAGLLTWGDVGRLSIIMMALTVLFYALLRSGFNKRFSDPSLTFEMIACSLGVIIYAVALERGGDQTLLVVLMLSFIFGVFRLATRQLLLLTALVIVGYAFTLAAQGVLVPEAAGFRRSVATLAILALTLTTFSWMGGHISHLRRRIARGRRKLEKAVARIEHIATHDDLTGLHNRRYLEQRLNEEARRAQRYGTGFSVCLLDLDRFKSINDTHGHAVGDEVLKSFAAAAHGSLRGPDCFGRWGGEEFLLLMPETGIDAARVAAERIAAAQRTRIVQGLPPEMRVTTSGGLACYRPKESVDDLIGRADEALYRAKDLGRDRIEAETGTASAA